MGEKYQPKPGDRVRVTYDATIRALGPAPKAAAVVLGTYGGTIWTVPEGRGDREIVSVEKLPDPEPEWQVGDYALARDGHVVECWYGQTWRNTRGHTVSDENMWRPLVLLIRDGKPVTP